MSSAPPDAQEKVLSTLNKDGTRLRIRPRLSKGRFLRWRYIIGYALIVFFVAAPFITIGGRPFFLLDIPRREFHVFGASFLATDTIVLMLFLVAVVISIFLLTALFGRLWCGWACPQTIYMELLFRPLERLFEGSPTQQRRFDREGGGARRFAKNIVFFILSFLFANAFIAYFVGGRTLVGWMTGSPGAHPVAFVAVAITTLAMFLDFAWFREQTCIVACPYGRLQSVLLDKQSLIVAYDTTRGEPRARFRERKQSGKPEAFGDCIDCGSCVRTCPTGIDIREGLQMECIGCTQCIDACDAMMDGVKMPRGLIRYTSQEMLEGGKKKLLRPRVVVYPLILGVVVLALGFAIASKQEAEVTLLRGLGAPFTLIDEGRVSNHLRIRIVNRSKDDNFRIALSKADQAAKLQLIAPTNPVEVKGGASEMANVFVIAPQATFSAKGEREVALDLESDHGFKVTLKGRILGPLKGQGQ